MGQSASRHGGGGNNENDDNANATAKIIKNSLFELSAEELKLLLDYCWNNENNSKRIDAAELPSVARSLQQAKTDNNKNTEASSSSEETSDSGASRGCGTIYDDDQIQTPNAILGASGGLAVHSPEALGSSSLGLRAAVHGPKLRASGCSP